MPANPKTVSTALKEKGIQVRRTSSYYAQSFMENAVDRFFKKDKPIEAEKVVRFMVNVAHQQPISCVHVYESNLISQQYAITRKSITEKTHGQSKKSIKKE